MYKGTFDDITLSLVGDVMLAKKLPKKLPSRFEEIIHLLDKTECVIGNLETSIHDGEGVPCAFPGGGYAMAKSSTLSDLKRIGFSMFACANNHAMDYGETGLIATSKNLDSFDFVKAGIGCNLSEASRPGYFDCQSGRISLISITSSFHDSYLAGPQNQDMRGRPGVNPLRHNELYEIDPDQLNVLMKIAEKSGINSYHEQAIKEGYLNSDKKFKFGSYNFIAGTTGVNHTTPNILDLNRTISSIKEATVMSDLVVVSIHGHQFKNLKEVAPQFIEEFGRSCIDNGADIIFCHGPHVLRGIERYKSGIIFYGLGNFILQQDQMDTLPEEYYWKYSTTRQECYGVSEAYLRQSANNTRGLNAQKQAWESMVVRIDWKPTYKNVTLFPIQLNRYGIPELSKSSEILQHVANLSKVYNTNIIIKNSEGVITWK